MHGLSSTVNELTSTRGHLTAYRRTSEHIHVWIPGAL